MKIDEKNMIRENFHLILTRTRKHAQLHLVMDQNLLAMIHNW
jgi:hypothetical protein